MPQKVTGGGGSSSAMAEERRVARGSAKLVRRGPNPNSRRPKPERSPKPETRITCQSSRRTHDTFRPFSDFGLRPSFGLRSSAFASSFLNCTQNGFNILLHATSSWISFRHTLVRQDRTFISTCASRNIGTAAREGPVFREIVTSADGEALSHFGSGSASLGFLSRRHPRQPLQPISWFRFGLRDGSQLRQ